jgi:N-acyl-phosphatidylethanolamine-hydrolysing phospholipase D
VRDLDLTCTPAQHFSGRRLGNRDSTLWCGWVIRAGDRAIYFAGDTGRHPEFGAIARTLGPFDAVLLPIGAYEPRWFMRPVHMDPAEAVEAYREIAAPHDERSPLFVAMHWGTFVLTDEPVDEPPRLTREHWARAELPDELLWIPRHGETRHVAE